MLGLGVRRFAIVASFALAIAASNGRAAAQTTALVVRSTGLSDERALEFTRAVQAHVESQGRTLLTVPAEGPTPDLTPAIRDGLAAYHDLRPADALATLDAALASYERVGLGLDRPALLEALSYRALAAQSLGRADEALAAIDRLVVIDATYHPDATHFPPSFRRLVDERRSLVRIATLRLLVAPTASRVLVDAEPATLDEGTLALAVGRHVVRVEAPGHAARTIALDLPLEGEERLLRLEPDPIAQLRHPGSPALPLEPLLESARALGVAIVVLDLEVVDDRLHARLFDSLADRSREDVAPTAVAAAALVAELVAEDEVMSRTSSPPSDPRRTEARDASGGGAPC